MAGVSIEDVAVNGEIRDKTSLQRRHLPAQWLTMTFNRGPQSRFTPYVGAGLGFAWNELKRVHCPSEPCSCL